MANIIAKLDDEYRWGAILGILQRDNDNLLSALSVVLREIHDGCVHRIDELSGLGIEKESDGEYMRYLQLESLLGGLSTMFAGCDGILTSTIMEMLRDIDDDSVKSKKEE